MIELTPVQNIVFKLARNIPLDDVVKHKITMLKSLEPGEMPEFVAYHLTEQEYFTYLQKQGRAYKPDEGPVRSLVLAAGRRSGKTHLLGMLAVASLEDRVSCLGKHTALLIAPYLSTMFNVAADVASLSKTLGWRKANDTSACKMYQTDEDIAFTGTWAGSQRQARASLYLRCASSDARGIRGRLCMFAGIDEISQVKNPDELYQTSSMLLHKQPVLLAALGTPSGQSDEWLQRTFESRNTQTLCLQIPTWEMRGWADDAEWLDSIQSILRGIPVEQFLMEYGACFKKTTIDMSSLAEPELLVGHDLHVTRSSSTQELEREMNMVVEGVTDEHDEACNSQYNRSHEALPLQDLYPTEIGPLSAIGYMHRQWQDKNFDKCTSLTQALALSEECGEVCRAVLKTHHGIRESDRGQVGEELADVILVATALANRLGIDIDAEVQKKAAKRDQKDFRKRPDSG